MTKPVGSIYYSQSMSSLCIEVNRLGAIKQIILPKVSCCSNLDSMQKQENSQRQLWLTSCPSQDDHLKPGILLGITEEYQASKFPRSWHSAVAHKLGHRKANRT